MFDFENLVSILFLVAVVAALIVFGWLAVYVIAFLIAAALLVDFVDGYRSWTEYDPPRGIGPKKILAEGRINEGRFVLTRQSVPGGYAGYPVVLTRTVVDSAGAPISVIARLIRRADDDGPVHVGTHWGRDVVVNVASSRYGAGVYLTTADAFDTWQVYPPRPDQTIPIEFDTARHRGGRR